MLKIAALVWIMLGTTLAGVGVTIVLTVPGIAADVMKAIPVAAGIGFVVAVPAALVVAKKILGVTPNAR